MPRNKWCGLDGLSAEFYKMFWIHLKDSLLEAYNYAKATGTLHLSARRGVLSLIPKRNKDRTFLTHWRPISLLSTEFKILSKALANRIKLVLGSLISPEQAGFVQDRNIHDNVCKLFDLLEVMWLKNELRIVVSVDFAKAFD